MLSFKNKFIFAPVKIGYTSGDGKVSGKHLDFYTKRSRWAGAVDLEPLYMDKGLRELPTQLGIDGDDKIEGLKRLTDAIHKTDTKVIANLNHPGRMANPKIAGNYFVSSTNRACEAGGPVPGALDVEGIRNVVKMFTESALRTEKAGIDVIELQFGHGYLVAQFISDAVNDRRDGYGGSWENRIKLPLEILSAVKKAVSIPVIARISGDEMTEKGIKLPDMIKFAGSLEAGGIDGIHVSAGSLCTSPPWFFHHMFVPKGKIWELAGKIKEAVGVPVIFVGKVNTREDIELLESKYHADFIAAGRALVADSEFFGKISGDVREEIRPCLECSQGCLGGVKAGKGLQCLVNPIVGKEPVKIDRGGDAKNGGAPAAAVVGGGLAGMEAALVLARRGFKVDLFEKNSLGGQFVFAYRTPKKPSMGRLIPYYESQLELNGVNVIKREALAEDLVSGYDRVVLATGAVNSVPPIPGLVNYRSADILLDEVLPSGKKILVIGGGLTGVDIATALVSRDNRVILVKRSTDFGQDMEMISKKLSLKMLKEKGVVFSDYTHIKGIDGGTVTAERKGEKVIFEDVDIIIVSTGVKSYNPLAPELEGRVPFIAIGDAREIGDAQDAIYDAYVSAASL